MLSMCRSDGYPCRSQAGSVLPAWRGDTPPGCRKTSSLQRVNVILSQLQNEGAWSAFAKIELSRRDFGGQMRARGAVWVPTILWIGIAAASAQETPWIERFADWEVVCSATQRAETPAPPSQTP